MKQLSKLQIWTIAICLTVMLGAMKADEVKQEELAQAQLKESIQLAKQEKLNDQRKLRHLYIEAQYKTGFPAKEKFAVNP